MGPGPAGTLRGQRETGLFCTTNQPQLFPLPLCGGRRQCTPPANQGNHRSPGSLWLPQSSRHAQAGGWRDNHKRIYRLYREQGLSLRLKRLRRNKSAQRRQPQPQGLYPNHVWVMDFVSDALFDGRRLRLLTVIDLYTRECLGICVGQNLRSTEVAEMLNAIALRRPLPQLLKTDNGSELAGKMLDKWVYERGNHIDFSRPGTPTDNATVESFNGRLRQECLNENWFMSLEDARCKIEAWRIHYNQRGPHSALGWMTPSEFAEKSAGCQNMQPT